MPPASPEQPARISKTHALHLAAAVELIRLWRERAEKAEAQLTAMREAASDIIDGRATRDRARQRSGWRRLRQLLGPRL
jgi:hypothetical protein